MSHDRGGGGEGVGGGYRTECEKLLTHLEDDGRKSPLPERDSDVGKGEKKNKRNV